MDSTTENPPDPPTSYDPALIARHFNELGMREWDRLEATPADEISLHILAVVRKV